jgi:hypothetical protein
MGHLTFIWAKVGSHLEAVKAGTVKVLVKSLGSASASDLTAKIIRPETEEDFMFMLHLWLRVVTALGVVSFFVAHTYKSITNYVWALCTWNVLKRQADPRTGVERFTEFMQSIKVMAYEVGEPRMEVDLAVLVVRGELAEVVEVHLAGDAGGDHAVELDREERLVGRLGGGVEGFEGRQELHAFALVRLEGVPGGLGRAQDVLPDSEEELVVELDQLRLEDERVGWAEVGRARLDLGRVGRLGGVELGDAGRGVWRRFLVRVVRVRVGFLAGDERGRVEGVYGCLPRAWEKNGVVGEEELEHPGALQVHEDRVDHASECRWVVVVLDGLAVDGDGVILVQVGGVGHDR